MKKRGAQFKRVDPRGWIRVRMPLNKEEKELFQRRYYAAIDSFPRGKADRDAWETLADSINMAKSICLSGLGTEYGGVIESAIDALAGCRDRFKKLQVWRMSGDELKAVRAVLPVLDAQYDVSTIKYLGHAVNDVREKLQAGDRR